MDKTVKDQTVGDELKAAQECMIAAMNCLSGPYGKAHGRCVSDLYYACYHLANALLASKGISAGSHEAVQKLLALHFVRPAALPRDTTARLNDLMDKRHVADYRPYIPIGAREVAEFRPWIAGFVRDVLKVMGASAPAEDVAALRRAAGDLEKIKLD